MVFFDCEKLLPRWFASLIITKHVLYDLNHISTYTTWFLNTQIKYIRNKYLHVFYALFIDSWKCHMWVFCRNGAKQRSLVEWRLQGQRSPARKIHRVSVWPLDQLCSVDGELQRIKVLHFVLSEDKQVRLVRESFQIYLNCM